MSREVVLIGKRGDCIRVPDTDMPKYQLEGYRPWNGPVPGPGQETVHDIPGGSQLLAAEARAIAEKAAADKAAAETAKPAGAATEASKAADAPAKPIRKKPAPKVSDGTE